MSLYLGACLSLLGITCVKKCIDSFYISVLGCMSVLDCPCWELLVCPCWEPLLHQEICRSTLRPGTWAPVCSCVLNCPSWELLVCPCWEPLFTTNTRIFPAFVYSSVPVNLIVWRVLFILYIKNVI